MTRDPAALIGAALAALPIIGGLAVALVRLAVLIPAAVRETWPRACPAPVLLTAAGIALVVTFAAYIA